MSVAISDGSLEGGVIGPLPRLQRLHDVRRDQRRLT